MTKRNKTLILSLAVVVAVFAVGGIVLNQVAAHQLRKELAAIPGTKFDFKRVNISLFAGNVEVKGVDVTVQDSTGTNPQIQGHVGALKLEHIQWFGLFKGKAIAKRLVVKDGSIGLCGQKDATRLSAKGINLAIHDIGYVMADSSVVYNDSLYSVAVDSLDYIDAQGLSRIQIGHFATADAGPVEALGMRMYNCVPQEALAEKMGKVSVMWYDVKLDSLYTSPLNLPRMAKAQSIEIESIGLSGPEIVLLQDDRYPPAVPYPTIQESLNTVKMPLRIGQIDARVKLFTFLWETTHVNRGAFPMHNLNLTIKSVSNAPGNVMEMDIKSGRKGKARLDFSLFTKNDKKESTRGRMLIYNLEASSLDPFMRPLFGATATADIHKIDSQFKGDKDQMTNDFCMLYENLVLHAWDDANAPIQIVAKNSGAINFLANLAVPKANPVVEGKDPKVVEAQFERDPWLPYPSYIIQNLTLGMLKTVLPGGAVKKAK